MAHKTSTLLYIMVHHMKNFTMHNHCTILYSLVLSSILRGVISRQVAVRVRGKVCPTATLTALTAHPECGVTGTTELHPLPP